MKLFLAAFVRSGLGKIVLAVAALVVGLNLVVWVGNPFSKDAGDADWNASSAQLPPVRSTTPVATLPPGFPSLSAPPPMVDAAPGLAQSVPTRFGLSYSVPNGHGWRPSNKRILGWSDQDERIATYGSVSDYGYGSCPESEQSWIGFAGVQGRNGVDIETAAREEVSKAERVFAAGGKRPEVNISAPRSLEIDGRPAIRYTATVSDIPRTSACGPERAHFDVVATAAYSSAEVLIFVIEHHEGVERALTEGDVDAVIASLHRTE